MKAIARRPWYRIRWGWIWNRRGLVLLLGVLAAAVVQEMPPPGAMSTRADGIVAGVRFDVWGWEVEAVWAKLTHWLLQPQRYVRDADRREFVRDYMARIGQIQVLEGQIAGAYGDPAIDDPGEATAEMRATVDRLRDEAWDRQLVAEAIVEEQVGLVLARQGLGLFGRPFPPVGIHFSPLPYFVIISPRDRIATIHQQELQPGLGVAEREAIEAALDSTLDVSSLVTGIGGMSAWPAMLLETSSLTWALEVTAHEWTHHYLYLYPLGWDYDRDYQTRVINETTASIVDREIGQAVLALYYPELVQPISEGLPASQSGPDDPPRFDFQAEMHATRLEVDRLLADGQVEAAESYMEERRRFFWENGYHLRKLNQAYFAFHGSYASEPGAAGQDPIGPAVQALRAQSPDLQVFLTRVRRVTTLGELEAALSAPEE